MKILILHQHFNTPAKGGAIRSYYLAKALVERGIETVVITGCNEKKYKHENIEGIQVHFLSVAYDNSFGFFARSISFVDYIFKSVKLAKNMVGFDKCYAMSVPLTIGIAAYRLKTKLKLPFIFEVGDLWPDAPIQMGFVKNSMFASLLYRLEKFIYKEADSVVALSSSIKVEIERKISNKKVHVIPNFSDCEFYRPDTKSEALEEKYGVKNKFVVSYIGALGAANGLEYFIECANVSRKKNLPIHFILCGTGAMLERLKTSVEKLKLNNISITGLVNRDSVKEIMNVTDAAFICYKNVPVLETGSPNKYFDALASGKLIITNFGGWIREEIEETGCGISLDPTSPASFVEKIQSFISNKEKLMRFQQSARQLAEEKYDRKKLSDFFARIF
ncbi:MAG: glycosyltransferase family 4 protein [Cyclobacteriaceae bacterium]